jgi:DNA-binding cell septation regulator SpoVG
VTPKTPDLTITDIKLRLVEEGKDGLVAWASCVIGGSIILNNIAVRRGQDGNLFLTYPAKQTAAGTKYNYFNPISREAADLVERAIMSRIRELSVQYRPGQEGAVSER